MNEKIKSFAIECAGQKEWDFPKDPESYTFTPDELKKFAELIVKQCAQLADDCPDDYLRQPYKYPSTYIKEHFGVKL